MGETRVDLQHLLEDLRDAYTGALEETILTEAVANALDSGATRIRLLTRPADATLTVVDDGRGMQRKELARSQLGERAHTGRTRRYPDDLALEFPNDPAHACLSHSCRRPSLRRLSVG